MTYYKSYRIIDGKPKLVIIDDNGNIIKNPTKEQTKDTILEDHDSSKYDQFKVDPKPYNDAYKSLMSYLGDRKFFGIEDVKKWSSIS